MTAEELLTLRRRMGWSRHVLAHELDISESQLQDYERGASRGENSVPVLIPRVVELAVKHLATTLPARPAPATWPFRWRKEASEGGPRVEEHEESPVGVPAKPLPGADYR